MTAEFLVETKTWLRPGTFRELHQFATKHQTTVDAVLSAIADRAVEASKPKPSRRTYTRMTPQLIERASVLYRAGMLWREIAEELGVSTSSLANHKTQIMNAKAEAS